MKRIYWTAPTQLDCGGMHTLAPFYSWDQSVICGIKKSLESVLYTCQEIDNSLENLINTCRTVPDCDPKKSSSVVPILGDDSFDEDIISVSASTTQAGNHFSPGAPIACAITVVNGDQKGVQIGNSVPNSNNMVSPTISGVDFANVAGQLFDFGLVLSQGSAGLLGNVCVFFVLDRCCVGLQFYGISSTRVVRMDEHLEYIAVYEHLLPTRSIGSLLDKGKNLVELLWENRVYGDGFLCLLCWFITQYISLAAQA